ncbi:hypothetical protein PFISCL1PPCAC_2423, partial [Pristionchus fissidentatus]
HPPLSDMGGARRERSLSTCQASLLSVPIEMDSLVNQKRAGSITFSDSAIVAGTSTETYVRLSIGGKSYVVRTELWTNEETLMHRFIKMSHPERLEVADDFLSRSGEYYFERNTHFTDHIMDFYSTGTLHRPSHTCLERFKQELTFWEIPLSQLAPCCNISASIPNEKLDDSDDWETEFDGVCLSSIRLRVWKFMEDPQSSVPAALFAFFSVFFVFASVLGLILGSMPEFQADNSNASFYHMMHSGKRGDGDKFSSSLLSSSEFVYRPTDDPHSSLIFMEYICIAWFTFEYLIRVIIAPRRYEFFCRTLNLIDLLTILPFYLELALPLFGVYASKFKEFTGAMLVIRILRVLRMARVFKLARYSTSLQTFGHTLQSSITELSMLSMFLLTGIIFFSTVMYYLEKDEPYTDFYSIPAGCWWCVVTMATVGYGDAKPVTTLGKLVATATSICGIIVLAFPISMIVEKFASAQQKSIEEAQIHQAQMSAVANNYLLRRFPTRRRVHRDSACKGSQRQRRVALDV